MARGLQPLVQGRVGGQLAGLGQPPEELQPVTKQLQLQQVVQRVLNVRRLAAYAIAASVVAFKLVGKLLMEGGFFPALGALAPGTVTITGRGEPQQAIAMRVSGDFSRSSKCRQPTDDG